MIVTQWRQAVQRWMSNLQDVIQQPVGMKVHLFIIGNCGTVTAKNLSLLKGFKLRIARILG